MAGRFRDLKKAVDEFRTYIGDAASTALRCGDPFGCDRIAEPSFRIQDGERPGVYAFLDAKEGMLEDAQVADIGKSQQECGVQRRITENYKEYQLEKNRGHSVTHCIAFTWPAELHFLAPALESFLIDRVDSRDNKRRRG